jgi:formate--tetrahydrofolate ligase
VSALSNLEIARTAKLEPIQVIGERAGLTVQELEPHGAHKAKVLPAALARLADRPDGALVLVTAITPTAAGEGKSTTTVGLGDAFRLLGRRAVVALREPSLGPCFGIKGGAAGGGYAQVVPMEDINLHFTGDLHAVTAAHNLLAALVDNHLFQGNALHLDPRRVAWPRVLDMNDRALRHVVVGLGGPANGVPRESGFEITVASELMAILCLARDLGDLRARIARVVLAERADGSLVTAGDLKAAGAATVLLRDALKPNLVQTLAGTPAFVHGGPFGNIAHGCSSLAATRLALKLADIVVTEAGFATELGAEKFLHIKCRTGGLAPAAAAVVATVRALKLHGGAARDRLAAEDLPALRRGLPNLEAHVANVRAFGVPAVVALNHFASDTDAELGEVLGACARLGVPARVSRVFEHGGAGAADLAEAVLGALRTPAAWAPLYADDLPLAGKIEAIATRLYGADGVDVAPAAAARLSRYEALGFGGLPVCMAKTQHSLSDDPRKLGRPRGFRVTVRDARLAAGAGFVIAYTGDVLTMPGLPRIPAAETIDIDAEGNVVGLF